MAGRRASALALCLLSSALLCPIAQAAGPEGALDGRGWEMASPAAKNAGEIEAPKATSAAFQAAVQGGATTFGSATSFGQAQGAGPLSQYLSVRSEAGWATQNLTPPQLSGTYSAGAYLAFSEDLSRSLLTNGWRCRGGESECEAQNPPLASGAPSGYRNLYLREGATYTPLVTTANFPDLPPDPNDFVITPQGASPNLSQVAFSTATGLYEWSAGTVTKLSADPSAALGAPAGAISPTRTYYSEAGKLFLREGAQTKLVSEGGEFQAASKDGSLAYFSKEGSLYRYEAPSDTTSAALATEVKGVLGTSEDGAYLYYLTAQGLFLHHEGTETKAAAGADEANYPPATGTARLTPNGTHLAFISSESLTGYANVGKTEVFAYDATSKKLLCASCNPKGNTPLGASSLPAARTAGEGSLPYKPRALSQEGTRLFFDSSDRLLNNDTDAAPDVYQWSAQGTSGCTKAAGCIALVSSGRNGSASFLDASSDGTDAYFLTPTPLSSFDSPASADVYDARALGGFPEPPPQIPCVGDACQGPPPEPDDPQPGTSLLEGPHNPVPRFAKTKAPKKHHKHRKGKKGHHKHREGKGGKK